MNYAVCVPYYSLPEFPLDCKVIKNHNVIIRDILLCNPYNDIHILGGVQIDPHIETLEYINCQPIVREGIAKRAEKYDDIKILFRTRFVRLGKVSDYLVMGYYVVNPKFHEICRDAPVIKASSARFVSLSDCINITSLMKETRAFRSCFTTENEGWKDYLEEWIKHINNRRDVTLDYINEITRLKEIYSKYEFQGTGILYEICQNCSHDADSCFLVWRRQRFGTLQQFPGHYE